ncbi:6719_t:CDS:2 [Entrophospora sp. SA101]|nr:7427_t:CDS:2 [Entrophospora sp. SA101]CAJ0824606.1 6719_t:CDS:2 [Entrophospora sp. SA101]
MSLKLLKEFGIEKEADINDLKGLEINFLAPNRLEIIVPHLPAAETIKILGKLGLTNIRFAVQQKEKEKNAVKNNSSGDSGTNSKVKRGVFNLSNNPAINNGISSPADYAMSARQKNYAALAVTEHYNVQSFPEFSNHQNNDLQIIYGCEMEMLEDDFPPYIFNHSKHILEEKIAELTYCVFDLETTGFFSEYNEIIEIGYVVYRQGEIVREGEYLICPEKEIPAEILATWYTNIDPEELKKAPTIKEILPTLLQE